MPRDVNNIDRTLICIATYQAEYHIEQVLRRLPKEIWNSKKYHVLLSDDASNDDTTGKAKHTFEELGANYTILKLHINQGYGGNQKVCYRYAIEQRFDRVIMLHGNGQYAPELILDFIKHFDEQGVDIVLGSRMMKIASAKKGKMPLYKIVGNFILTWIQNKISNQKLTDFHTGYRAYTTEFLKSIPFELNSNDFDFDTEILLQAFHSNAKIHEFLVPTHYGDEISRVSGLKYAWQVFVAALNFRMQQLGIKVSLKYPYSANQIYRDKTDDPNSTHSFALNLILSELGDFSTDRKNILDIGCGPGHLAKKLVEYPVYITGIDYFPPENSCFSEFITMDLERDKWKIDIAEYDHVLILDVIEHFVDPEGFLLKLRHYMKRFRYPKIMISTPNIGFFLIRLNLLIGQFNYADRGILDVTHKRLFTMKTFKKLLSETGYEIESIRGVGVPFQTLGKNNLFKVFGQLSAKLARIYPSLFAFQFFAVIRPKPTTYQLIEFSQH
jgi:2-polyprenyl-3-methyl-5-hydroxy-6-metoxy-1,4-benzoquinol methylase